MNGTDDPNSTSAAQPQQPRPDQQNPQVEQVQPQQQYQQQQQPPPNWAPPAMPHAQPDPRRKSPFVAVALSLMPGLGQVYVGYYQRGFIHILVVASLIAFLAAQGPVYVMTPFAGLFLAFFWLYNLVDAGRRAMFYNHALQGEETLTPPEDFKMPSPGGSIFGGICLLGVGIILLSNTLFDFSLDWMEDWWPVALFVPGVWLIVKAIQEKSQSAGDAGQDAEI
jgi:hypothetical protein